HDPFNKSNAANNIPVQEYTCPNIPVAQTIRVRRRYVDAKTIVDLAIREFKKNGRGISFRDLLINGLAKHKNQAKSTLKHHLSKGNLFTLGERHPQQYYPKSLEADVMGNRKSNNIPVAPTVLG